MIHPLFTECFVNCQGFLDLISVAGNVAERVPTLLRRRVRPAFEPLLQQIAAGEIDAVLATAAAGEYALPLGRQLGFRHVLATPCRLPPDGALNHREEDMQITEANATADASLPIRDFSHRCSPM